MPGRFLQRLTAMVLLGVYTLTGTSALPAAIAWLADLDGSHQLIVSEAGPDDTRLILHHWKAAYTPEVCDHRQALTRVIVRLCGRTGQGDHLLATRHLSDSYENDRDAGQREVGAAPVVNDGETYALFGSPLSRINLAPQIIRRTRIVAVDDATFRRPIGSTLPMLI